MNQDVEREIRELRQSDSGEIRTLAYYIKLLLKKVEELEGKVR